jgi:putative ABC transport system permease protein
MRDRLRTAFAIVTLAPWRRAPMLALRRPGVLAGVAGASALLAASVAAVPVFLSSVGTEAVAVQAADRCSRATGATYGFRVTADSVVAPGPDPFAPLRTDLGPAVRSVRAETTLGDPATGITEPVVVISRDGALDHVEVVEGTPGPGVWVSDRGAAMTGLAGGGARATIGGVEVPVAGVYRDMAGAVPDFWCVHAGDLALVGPERRPPPPVVLADPATFATLVRTSGVREPVGAWDTPLREGVTVARAARLVDALGCETDDAPALDWCADGPPRIPTGYGRVAGEGVEARDAAEIVSVLFRSHLPFVVDRTRAIQTSVGAGVWPVAAFAALAGAALVAAAGSLWFDRRRREITLLTVRGASPAALGLKAVLELALPLVAGTAAGVALGIGAVRWVGPSPSIEPSAIVDAIWAGAGALVAAAAVIGGVVAGRVRVRDGLRRRRGWMAAVPWELLTGLVAAVSFLRLDRWGAPASQGAEVSRVDPLGLLFPVLFLTATVAVVMRLLTLALRPLLAASRRWPIALYLGIRRVARYRGAVVGLVAASAVAAGVLGYAATLRRSMDATLEAKAETFLGSDVAVRVSTDEVVPEALAGRTTEVDAYRQAWIGDGEREDVDVYGIDPATFAAAAFWDAGMADSSLPAIVDRLAAAPRDRRVPAVVVGPALGDDLPATIELGIATTGTTRLTLEPVPGVHAFPGMKRGSPTVFVAASALRDAELRTRAGELWVAGDRDEILAALDAAGTDFYEPLTRAMVVDQVAFLTVSWTFGFMQSLGVAAGALVIGGVAVHLDARRRGRVLGYAFARRMGLTRRRHRWALLVELVASVVVGCWLGLGLGLVGAALAHQRLDPAPGFRPDPLFRPAIVLAAAVAAVAVVVAGVAAVLAQRRTDRDDPVEVLRAGT